MADDSSAPSPEDLSAALTRADADQFARDPAEYRRKRRGRAGTGGREVDAWWPHIERALRDGHTQKRVWEHLRNLDDTGPLPRLTIQYRQFNQLVSRRWAELRSPLPQPSGKVPPNRPTQVAVPELPPQVDHDADESTSPYMPPPAQLTESPPRGGDYGRVTKGDAKKLIG